SADGHLTPEANRAARRPVLLFQGGVHAGEIDGKDAGFLVLKELLATPREKSPLTRSTLVFVPVFNVDGHERFGPNHRPNQRGPEEMGWRVSAQNLNLNRDYAKADAPEMRHLLGLLNRWDPILYVDLHVTDGAKFQPDMAVLIEPMRSGPEPLRRVAAQASAALLKRLEAEGHLPLPFYPSFERNDDPASGFAAGVPPPRFSNGYWAVRNRLGVLVETHSWRPYPHRVRTTANVIRGLVALAAASGGAWLDAAAKSDAETRALRGELPVQFAPAGRPKPLAFPGYAYRREPSEISGGLRTVYDESKPQVWTLPWDADVVVKASARVPATGYLVPAAHAAWVAERLQVHGIAFERTSGPATREVEVFRATDAKFRAEPYEGRQTVKLEGAWTREKREVPQGSLVVPVAQPLGRLVVQLFDPVAPDAFVSWGFFNAAFEQKEYMEDYVAEEEARAMLARDPSLAGEFARRLEDPAFARDPGARLRFFYARHPSFDERYRLYPVYRF
ncbi:MAG: M14 family zinc carboxypeptidase, partial [Myxococcales bacterium]